MTINEFLLKRRTSLCLVPIKERSLEIFGDEKRLESGIGDRLVDSLSRRGLQARHHALTLGSRPIAVALQDACREVGAGVLAMGGYGHSRLRDFLVGGATKGVLAALSVPVLMSH